MADQANLQPESGLDWNELWKQAYSFKADWTDEVQEAYWDRRAPTFGGCATNAYITGFLDHAGVRPGETVIDMGCGSGSLAIPLGKAGNRVLACDLSGGMLERVKENAEQAGVTDNVETRKISWLADWAELPVADVFIASRSLCTTDLRETVLKIEAHTRRCCCMTLPTVYGPGEDVDMLRAIGRDVPEVSECVYLVNLLWSMGRLPEFCYLEHVRPSFGPTREELRAEYERESGPFTPQESAKLDEFIDAHFSFEGLEPGSSAPKRDYDRFVRWAFVKWDVPKGR